MKNSTENKIGFLQGGGEMGELIRNYDWDQSELGIPENWPHSLQTTIGIILHAASPMFLFWGKDLLCFYNDAYRPSLGDNGKHPLIGKGGKDGWPEIWDFIGPLIEKVITTGEAVWFEDQKLPIHRNGKMEDVYWTFSYSPAYGDQNTIEGVFVTCLETTANIIAAMELKAAHDKIEKSQEQLLSYFEQSPVAIAIIDKENLTFNLVNTFYADLVGRKREEIEHKPLLEALPELKGQGFEDLLNNVISTGIPFVANEVAASVRKNGVLETIYVNFTYQPQYNLRKEINGIFAVIVDVTQQVRSRKIVEDSEARFRSLIEEAPVATCLFVGRELVIEVANDLMLAIWGKKNSVMGKRLEDALPELKGQPFLQILDDVFTTGKPYSAGAAACELEMNGVLGIYYFNFTYKPLFNEKNEVYGIVDMAIDVTEQVLARQKIEESETKLQTIIAAAPAGIGLFVGRDLIIENPNQTFIDIVGKGPGIVGLPLREAMPELITEGQAFLKILDDVYTSGIPFISHGSLVKIVRNGVLNDNYYNISYTPMRNSQGEIYAILDIAIDVTEQIKAQLKVEESEARFRTMAEGTDIYIAVGDESSNATYFNKAWTKLTGRPMNELLEFGWVDLVHPDDKERYVNIYLDAFKIQGGFIGEFRILTPRGDYRWLLAHGTARFNSDGVFAGYVSSCVDITEQVETRKEIAEAVVERTKELAESNLRLKRSNEELEQFAYIASHDLQEPIRKISTFTQMLEHSIQDKSEKSNDYFSKIYSSTDRMTNLIRDVLAYSRIKEEPHAFEKVDLNKIIEILKIDFELQIEETKATIEILDLPIIDAIPSQMTQLFGNLLSNSLKYHKDGVKPVIKIFASIAKLEKVAKRLVLDKHKTYYHIQFSDNGIGFDKDHVERIFRIFQRLHGKTEFEGTGIGLAICNRIVQNHKGHISAAVGENGGATFDILLPEN